MQLRPPVVCAFGSTATLVLLLLGVFQGLAINLSTVERVVGVHQGFSKAASELTPREHLSVGRRLRKNLTEKSLLEALQPLALLPQTVHECLYVLGRYKVALPRLRVGPDTRGLISDVIEKGAPLKGLLLQADLLPICLGKH